MLIGLGTLTFNCQPVRAEPGTIYIRADGSVDPPTASISSVDNVTYTFTDNIYESIVVERDNIVIDGADYGLEGTGGFNSKGIDLTGRSNITIKNAEIKGFWTGIHLNQSSNNKVLGNNITNADWTEQDAYWGIILHSSNNNSLYGNRITNNSYGIVLWDFSGDG